VDQLELISRTSALSGLTDTAEVSLLLEVTTRALASCLSQPDRQLWAASLPRPLRELLLATAFDETQRSTDVYAAVARAEGVNAKFGIEHTQAAVRALADDLSMELRRRFARHLPDDLGELLLVEPPSSVPEASTHAQPARPGGEIASAAMGSTRPVSEAQPKGPPQGSVGAWDPARMDHSLASARSSPQPADTLAEGRPGSRRGLSDTERKPE